MDSRVIPVRNLPTVHLLFAGNSRTDFETKAKHKCDYDLRSMKARGRSSERRTLLLVNCVRLRR